LHRTTRCWRVYGASASKYRKKLGHEVFFPYFIEFTKEKKRKKRNQKRRPLSEIVGSDLEIVTEVHMDDGSYTELVPVSVTEDKERVTILKVALIFGGKMNPRSLKILCLDK